METTDSVVVTNKFFPEIKGNFGLGCMRMNLNEDGSVDTDNFKEMVDLFLEQGFNYFDTAHGYIDGQSEPAIRECLTSRYPRDRYVLTDKLTRDYFEQEEDIRKVLNEQLEACGVDYFDFYLLHSLHRNNYDHFKKCNAYKMVQQFKAEGLIRHWGISFHDNAEMLDRILTENPEIEVVQIQFNYLDYAEGAAVDSRRVMEVCIKHNKPVIVMEPVKGGLLVNLPEAAVKVFDELSGVVDKASVKPREAADGCKCGLSGVSAADKAVDECGDIADGYKSGNGDVLSSKARAAEYAIRFAAGFPQVMMVLSGMNNPEQLKQNTDYMRDFKSLNEQERAAVDSVHSILCTANVIPCTGCRYCVAGCPAHINIPTLFNCMNNQRILNSDSENFYYKIITSGDAQGAASDCIKCGKCELICPQHLDIRRLLQAVSAEFDK